MKVKGLKKRLLAISLIVCLFASILPPGAYIVSAESDTGVAVAKLVADNHVVMLRADGRLLVWGDNRYGQLGLGSDAPEIAYEPVEHPFFKDKKVRDVAVGEDTTHILLENGQLYAMGRGENGRLGLGGEGNIVTPTLIAGSQELRINKIHSGKGFTIAETDLNTLVGWGLNDKGQLGNGTNTNVLKPIKIMDNADVRELHVGTDFTVLIKQDSTYWGWGSNDKNQWGMKRITTYRANWTNASNSKCSYHKNHSSSYVDFWQHCNLLNSTRTLDNGVPASANIPTRLDNRVLSNTTTAICSANGTVTYSKEAEINILADSLDNYDGFHLGNAHGLVLVDNLYYGWGDNTYKQLGTAPTNQGVPYEQTYLNALINTTLPTLGLSVKRFIVGGDTNYLVTETNGIYSERNKVYVWGSNLSGKAGMDSTQAYYQEPTEIPALEELDIITVIPGRNTNYFISSTGSVYVAGDNLYGQSGLGAARKNDARIPVPTEIPIKFSETATPPAPPTKVEAPVEAVAGNTVTVEWDEVPDAVNYELTRTVAYSSGEIVQQTIDDDFSAVGAAATSEQVIYNGPDTRYVDDISPDWESIMYSVRALNYVGDYSSPIVTGNITVKIPTSSGNDTTPPTVSIITDATQAQITVIAEDTGSGVEGIYINGTKVATNVYTYKLSSGESISIYAKDKAGNVSSTRTIRYSDVVSGGGGTGNSDGSNSGSLTNEQLLALIAALNGNNNSDISDTLIALLKSNNSSGLSASEIALLLNGGNSSNSGSSELTPLLLALLTQQSNNSTGNDDMLMSALIQMATNQSQQSKDISFTISLPGELAAFLPQPESKTNTPIIVLLVILSVAMLGIVVVGSLYVFQGKKQHPIAATDTSQIDVEELEFQHNVLVKDFNRLMDDNNAVHAENAMLRAKLQAIEKQ